MKVDVIAYACRAVSRPVDYATPNDIVGPNRSNTVMLTDADNMNRCDSAQKIIMSPEIPKLAWYRGWNDLQLVAISTDVEICVVCELELWDYFYFFIKRAS